MLNIDVKIEDHSEEFLRKIEQATNCEVRLNELCNPTFMRKHTKYTSFEEMAAASDLVKGTDEEQVTALQSPEWDKWIAENTGFDSWQDMINTAGY